MPGITIRDLRFAYPGNRFGLRVNELRVAAGERFALLGPSGAGKTTLLRLMAGLLPPLGGEVRLGDVAIAELPEQARRQFRLGHLGLVFQDFALLDYLTVEENILLPMRFHGGSKPAPGEPDGIPAHVRYARELAERLEIAPHWDRLTARLSQGERQRVAIARALAHRPKFVFADEPTASLDAVRRKVVMDLLLDYARQNEACLVLVTHDQELMPLFPHRARVEEFAT